MNRETDIYVPAQKGYVVLDIESQGYTRYAPIEISVVRFSPDGKCLDAYTSLVRPRAWRVNPYVTELTGITTDMVRTAPPPSKVIAAACRFIGKSVIVGHAVGDNDIPIIAHYSNILFHTPFLNPYVDTFYWAQTLFPDLGAGHYNLRSLAEHFHIDTETYHRAEADCFTTASLYRVLHAHAVSLTWKERSKLLHAFRHKNDPKDPVQKGPSPINYNALPIYDGAAKRPAVVKLWYARGHACMELRFPRGTPRDFISWLDAHLKCGWMEYDRLYIAENMPLPLAADLLYLLKRDGCTLYRKDPGVFAGLENIVPRVRHRSHSRRS